MVPARTKTLQRCSSAKGHKERAASDDADNNPVKTDRVIVWIDIDRITSPVIPSIYG